jgi:hypothetical protein
MGRDKVAKMSDNKPELESKDGPLTCPVKDNEDNPEKQTSEIIEKHAIEGNVEAHIDAINEDVEDYERHDKGKEGEQDGVDEEDEMNVPDDTSEADETDEEDLDNQNVKAQLKAVLSGIIHLNTKQERDEFVEAHENLLGLGGNHGNNVLHHLASNTVADPYQQNSTLVRLLVMRFPRLLAAVNGNDDTPLHIAIGSKNLSFVKSVCADFRDELDSILRLKNLSSQTCLHLAVRCGGSREREMLVRFVARASEGPLLVQDGRGLMPLHLAVELEQCTPSQIEVVQLLIKHCGRALECMEPHSVYFHHVNSHIPALGDSEISRMDESLFHSKRNNPNHEAHSTALNFLTTHDRRSEAIPRWPGEPTQPREAINSHPKLSEKVTNESISTIRREIKLQILRRLVDARHPAPDLQRLASRLLYDSESPGKPETGLSPVVSLF